MLLSSVELGQGGWPNVSPLALLQGHTHATHTWEMLGLKIRLRSTKKIPKLVQTRGTPWRMLPVTLYHCAIFLYLLSNVHGPHYQSHDAYCFLPSLMPTAPSLSAISISPKLVLRVKGLLASHSALKFFITSTNTALNTHARQEKIKVTRKHSSYWLIYKSKV